MLAGRANFQEKVGKCLLESLPQLLSSAVSSCSLSANSSVCTAGSIQWFFVLLNGLVPDTLLPAMASCFVHLLSEVVNAVEQSTQANDGVHEAHSILARRYVLFFLSVCTICFLCMCFCLSFFSFGKYPERY